MRFSIKTNLTDKFSEELIKSKIKYEARKYIILAPKKASEIALDKYIVKNYRCSLERACLNIIYNCNISIGKENEVIVTFIDPELDKLATLITFGTGKITGCDLLVKAFTILNTSENKNGNKILR